MISSEGTESCLSVVIIRMCSSFQHGSKYMEEHEGKMCSFSLLQHTPFFSWRMGKEGYNESESS